MSATSSRSVIPTIDAGGGRIVLSGHGSNVIFSELSSRYPLKLLSPRIPQNGVAVVYALTYGGGLVGGDHVKLWVDVGPGAVLVLVSQGSTKVFKTRPGKRFASVHAKGSITPSHDVPKITAQDMDFMISAKSGLCLLPDPVTCFRSASYNQMQRFHLSGDASVVILDWITSGRKSFGEEWVFSRYYSLNEVWVDGKRLVKDVTLLDEGEVNTGLLPRRPISDRLAPFSCYATIILYGPLAQSVILDLTTRYEAISVFKRGLPEDLIWSLSPISSGESPGAVLRVAGKESEGVRRWLGDALVKLEVVIGTDVYRRAFA